MKPDLGSGTVRLRLRPPSSGVLPKARNSFAERPNGPLMGFKAFSRRAERAEDGVTVLMRLEQRCSRCSRVVGGFWPERVGQCTCGAWVWLRPTIRFGASAVRRNDAAVDLEETYRPALTA